MTATAACARLTTLGDSDDQKYERSEVEHRHQPADEKKPKKAPVSLSGRMFRGILFTARVRDDPTD